MEVEIKALSNPRTPEGGWKDMRPCPCCGSISSAYVLINVYKDNCLVFKNIRLCKGCLIKGENLIDKAILDQTKTRI